MAARLLAKGANVPAYLPIGHGYLPAFFIGLRAEAYQVGRRGSLMSLLLFYNAVIATL
ncbi:hypothetical protein [Prevotella sp.]|uniref:hypothetical protein n=1 Tax=Prevotella sp. TaxID=59823 RepID=UPI0027E2EF41|nr:hypothetical protein [Prevotella sp.]